MATVHMILQGKGGVGKSLVASYFTQYLLDRDIPVACFDTDPVNATFSAYKAINVAILDVMDGDNVNSRNFDSLMEQLLSLPPEAHAVVDNGASTFLPLASYIAENNVAEFLADTGHTLNLHTVITGGQSEGDTLQGLNSLLTNFKTPITIWVNPYFGKIAFNGHELEQMNKERNGHTLILPVYNRATFGFDIENMLSQRMTFNEALVDEKINIMARQRLKLVRTDLWKILDQAGIVDTTIKESNNKEHEPAAQ